jgi:predicted DNA repair protein MutK
MAGSRLLVLLDDIAAVLDDVSLLTKLAAKKTAGVLGDDLAVNAEKVTGVRAEREIPVVWAVAKGSFKNKLILVPAALVLSVIAPWLISPVLIIGGLYLCYEGFEKIVHHMLHGKEEDAEHDELVGHLKEEEDFDIVAFEQNKITGAIRTDFILSLEIIVLTLGIVSESPLMTKVLVLSGIAMLMTVGVYGLVAGIVKLDDAGLHLMQKEGEGVWRASQRWIGARLLSFAPWLMKALGVVGRHDRHVPGRRWHPGARFPLYRRGHKAGHRIGRRPGGCGPVFSSNYPDPGQSGSGADSRRDSGGCGCDFPEVARGY